MGLSPTIVISYSTCVPSLCRLSALTLKENILEAFWLLSETIKMPLLWHVFLSMILFLLLSLSLALLLFNTFPSWMVFPTAAPFCSSSPNVFFPLQIPFHFFVFLSNLRTYLVFAAVKRVQTTYPWLRRIHSSFLPVTILKCRVLPTFTIRMRIASFDSIECVNYWNLIIFIRYLIDHYSTRTSSRFNDIFIA